MKMLKIVGILGMIFIVLLLIVPMIYIEAKELENLIEYSLKTIKFEQETKKMNMRLCFMKFQK